MALQCPNCTRTLRFWSNYSGFCSKQCRAESTTSCPNCGTIGLFKHNLLGCCSEECRCWYAASLLGYDRNALLTPAEEKIVFHVRLPSNNPEIGSLQLDELDYERRHGTILVIAAPPWMTRHRVLAELPFERFDSPVWQHLLIDGTLDPNEVERFRGYLYDEPEVHQRLGETVYARLRGAGAEANRVATGVPPHGLAPSAPPAALRQHTTIGLPQTDSIQSHQLAGMVRMLFERRGFSVVSTRLADEEVFLLTRGNRQAVARYLWHDGMIDLPLVQQFVRWVQEAGVAQAYFVTNGHFTLQAEDWVASRAVQLIDGTELRTLTRGGPDLLSAASMETAMASRPMALGSQEQAVHPSAFEQSAFNQAPYDVPQMSAMEISQDAIEASPRNGTSGMHSGLSVPDYPALIDDDGADEHLEDRPSDQQDGEHSQPESYGPALPLERDLESYDPAPSLEREPDNHDVLARSREPVTGETRAL